MMSLVVFDNGIPMMVVPLRQSLCAGDTLHVDLDIKAVKAFKDKPYEVKYHANGGYILPIQRWHRRFLCWITGGHHFRLYRYSEFNREYVCKMCHKPHWQYMRELTGSVLR